ncbi:MAG: GtrA-like protein [Chloroflexi bacterium ADurb.Bin325]|nr:MAG: GtrA-like protein [Chloroflexi bacterium ADurb.Bin325]
MLETLAGRIDALTGGRGTREIKRFIKFGVVGASGFLVDFAILNLLLFWAGLPPWLANTCSFAVAVTNTFTWNRLWTFPESRQRPVSRQLGQFFIVNLVGLGINQLAFLGSHALVWQRLFAPALAWNLAKATASGIALFWNFSANRLWTWRGL